MAHDGYTQKCVEELERLHEDSYYSAQTYFESAKSLIFWGKSVVFAPALAASLASLLVAVGAPKELSSLSAIAGAVSATSAFLGSTRNGELHMEAAKEFTRIRHAARIELSMGLANPECARLETTLRSLRGDYDAVVKNVTPVSNRFFVKTQRRITKGVLQYDAG